MGGGNAPNDPGRTPEEVPTTMTEYKLANGYVLTDEEIEARAQQWESGSWEGGLIAIRSDNSDPSQHGSNEPGLAPID